MKLKKSIALGRVISIIRIVAIAILFAYIVFRNYDYAIINYDDYRFFDVALKMFREKGIVYTLYYSFFNMDLENQYRTYGLLRVFTSVWAAVFGFNPIPYGILIGILHCASSVGVYYVSRKIYNGKICSRDCFIISGIWLFNPFSVTQCMHHMLYMLMPVYMFLIVLLIDLYTHKNKYKYMFVFSVACVFFGENMMFALLFYLAVKGSLVLLTVKSKSKDIVSSNGAWLPYYIIAGSVSALLGFHYLHYKMFRYTEGVAERFSLHGLFNIKKNIHNLIIGISVDIKKSLIVWNKLNVAVVRQELSLGRIILYLFIILFMFILFSFGNNKETKLSYTEILTVIAVCLSTCFVYALLAMLGQPFGNRYMMGSVPWVVVGLFFLLKIFFNDKKGIIGLSLLFILGFMTFIHYDIMLEYMDDKNEQIIEMIDEGENSGEKYVLFVNAWPNVRLDWDKCDKLRLPGAFTDSEQFVAVNSNGSTINGSTIGSPFQMFWTEKGWFNAYSSMKPVYDYSDNGDGTWTLQGEQAYSNVSSGDIMVICTEDIYFFNDNRKLDISAYYDFDEFRQKSSAYTGIHVWNDESYNRKMNSSNDLDSYYALIHSNEIISIDCGNLDDDKTNLSIDKKYNDSEDADIRYGYIRGIACNLSEKERVTSITGDFLYKIDMDVKSKVYVCLEFRDISSREVGDRIFDINIETDNQAVCINDLDLYSIGSNNMVSLEIPLEETKTISISATKIQGDVPFCNVIRIIGR